MLKAVDVFAGGGGLTVGLKRAGFHVVAAIEIEQAAFSTYKANHPEVRGFKQDVRTVPGTALNRASPTGTIDLLAGCPPCQGFTSLTSKYSRYDRRNDLVLDMARLVREVLPTMVMIENVPGLAQKGKPLLDQLVAELEALGYQVTSKVLQVADYGIPQFRRRLVLLAGRGFEIPMPSPTHSRTGADGFPKWRTLAEAIGGMPAPIDIAEARLRGGPEAHDWHVVRVLSQRNLDRLRYIRPGVGRFQIPDHLRPDCHKGKDKGFSNVYGRMTWEQIPVTITAGCTTLSKGRFGHPSEDRTISVREAALIQTFPEDYIIDTPYIDRACEIVGNALPCDFAEIMAKSCAAAFATHTAVQAGSRDMS